MKQISILFFVLFCSGAIAGVNTDLTTIDDLLNRSPDNTECATAVIKDALSKAFEADNSSDLSEEQKIENSLPEDMKILIHSVINSADVMEQMIRCPEFQTYPDDYTIKFEPIEYDFNNGRKITISYETQPRIVRERIDLIKKHNIDAGAVSPSVGSDGAIWVNTDPAWYGIMVVEHGALSEFVGNGKNNTVSLNYLVENIDKIYPRDHARPACTSRSAVSGNRDVINVVTHTTVGIDDLHAQDSRIKKDSNDYYVAGDINLGWIMYAEIAADVLLTVATFGGGVVIAGVANSARAARAIKNLNNVTKVGKNLPKSEKTAEIIRRVLPRLDDGVSTVDDVRKTLQSELNIARNAKDEKSVQAISDTLKSLEKTNNPKKAKKVLAKNLKITEKEIEAGKNANRYENLSETVTNGEKRIAEIDDMLQEGAEIARREQQQGIRYVSNMENSSSLTKNKKMRDLQKNIDRINKQIQEANGKSGEVKKLKTKLKNEQQQLNRLQKQSRELSETEMTALNQERKALENDIKTAKKTMKELEQLDDVKVYKKAVQEQAELGKYLARLSKKTILGAKRGNVAVRSWRAIKASRAALKGTKNLNSAEKLARRSMKTLSAKNSDYLFFETLKFGAMLGRTVAAGGLLYGILNFAGDMFDRTTDSTADFTNNIQFKPFLLLSADDIQGQENVVNYGMWLMWYGDAFSAADDDAAYLQAMDFAEKFHQDLNEYQTEKGLYSCNVDIFVVRPIIRNPSDENPELYYLIMNDEPWTTEFLGDEYNIYDSDEKFFAVDTNVPTSDLIVEHEYDGTMSGPCTKPAASDHFVNKIYTSGRYAKIDSAFEKAMITKFRSEGGVSNEKYDNGGYTKYGVSSRSHPEVLRADFSRSDAEDIGYEMYTRYRINELPAAIRGDVFMALWGTGNAKSSIGLLQRVMGIPQSNVVDNATINAARNYVGDLRKKYLEARLEMFNNIVKRNPTQQKFLKGWTNAIIFYNENGCYTSVNNVKM